MRQALRAIVAGGLGFAVSFIAACGSSGGLLSSSDASGLSSQIQQVKSDLASGDCAGAADALRTLSRAVNNLPSTVNGTLRSNLMQGVSTVQSLAGRQCQQASTSSTPAQTLPSTTRATTAATAPTTPTRPHTTSTALTTPPPSTTATTPTGPGTTTSGAGSGGTGLGGSAGGGGQGAGNANGSGGNGG